LALWFLVLNGKECTADETAFEEMVMSVAKGELKKSEIAKFFANNSIDVLA
jgi:prophage maintenance system killer protein